MSIITWLTTNWQPLVIAILAVDAAIIPLFPSVGILKTIQTWLTALK